MPRIRLQDRFARRFGACLLSVLSIMLVTACQPRSASPPATPGKRPNVIFIVVDTLRADFVGSYGSSTETPNIDALASSGLKFTTTFSHIPATGPSHSSMFTGLLPLQHAVTQNAQVLGEDRTTIAEILRDNGYHTAGVVSLGVLQGRFGFGQGFDTYDDSFPDQWFRTGSDITASAVDMAARTPEGSPLFLFVHYSDPHEPYAPPNSPYPRMHVELDGETVADVAIDGLTKRLPLTLEPGQHEIQLLPSEASVARRVLFRQLKTSSEKKVTLSLGTGWSRPPGSALEKLNTAKLPATLMLSVAESPTNTRLRFFAYEELDAAEARRRYAGEVEFVDQQIGKLLEGLRSQGLMDDTIVILTSDHGEGLGNHGLMGHISQLYDSLVRVPLILSAPGRLNGGATITEPAAHIDIVPTILDLLGIEPDGKLSGKVLLGEGSSTAGRPILMTTFKPEAPHDLRAVFADDHKLIVNPETGKQELYVPQTDPGETHNLLSNGDGESVDTARILAAVIADAATSTPDAGPGDPASLGLSDEDVERLRELGYLRDE